MRQPSGSTPRDHIKGAIKRMILSGSHKVGDKLPACGELAGQFGISVRTVVHAVHELAEEGILWSLKGKGVFVKKMPRGSGKLTTVGLVYPASQLELLHQSYLTQILAGSMTLCGYYQIDLQIVAFRQWRRPNSVPVPPHDLARRVDGLILLGVVNDEYITECAQETVPLVLVDAQTQAAPVASVAVDNTQVMNLVMDHLYELGHRKIAYVDIRSQDDVNWGRASAWLDTADTRERREAYLAARRRLALTYERVYAVGKGGATVGVPAVLVAIRRDSEPPTAIVCYDEWWAVCLYRSLVEGGFRVPQDLSIASTAGTASGHFVSAQAVTCAVVDFEEMGKRAVAVLQRQARRGAGAGSQVERIGGVLEIGTTTAKPR